MSSKLRCFVFLICFVVFFGGGAGLTLHREIYLNFFIKYQRLLKFSKITELILVNQSGTGCLVNFFFFSCMQLPIFRQKKIK